MATWEPDKDRGRGDGGDGVGRQGERRRGDQKVAVTDGGSARLNAEGDGRRVPQLIEGSVFINVSL